MIKKIYYFIMDFFISQELCAHMEKINQINLIRRGRLITAMSLLTSIMVLGIVFNYFFIQKIVEVTLLPTLISAFIAIAIPFVIKYTKNIPLGGFLYILCVTVLFPIRAMKLGGIHSSVATWLVLIPILAGIFVSQKAAVIVTIITIAEAIFLTYCTYKYPEIKLLIDPQRLTIVQGVSISTLSIMLLGVSIFYEYERRRSEKKIGHQQLKLAHSAKLAALGEMAGGVAHEINNPLTIISGHAQKILFDLKKYGKDINTDQFADRIQKIDETVKRITKIVHSLRIVSRDSQKHMIENIRIHDIVSDIESLFCEKFKTKNIEFIRDYHQSQSEMNIFCDRVLVSQIFINLINNAYDALNSSSSQKKWFKLSIDTIDSNVVFKFVNNGEEIPSNIKNKIFQPFFTTKEVGKGTGIGLSISLANAIQNSGNLELDGNDKHTCFVLTLPKGV